MSDLDAETLRVMADGGRKLCDEAIAKWYAGKYGNDAAQKAEMVRRWQNVLNNISDLKRRLAQGMK